MLANRIHDSKFALVRTVEAELGRGDIARLRQRIDHRGELRFGRRQDAKQPPRGVERVVVSREFVREEHVPRHLAAQRRLRLAHLGLDEGMPGLPHHRFPPLRAHPLHEPLGALHLEDDRLAGVRGQDVGGVEREELVSVEQPALLVHRADPVRVTIESDSQIGPGLEHALLQGAHERGNGGIGQVVRKAAVRLGEDGIHLAPDLPEELRARDAGRPVSGIHDHAKLPLQLDAGDEVAQVLLVDRPLLDGSPCREHAGGDRPQPEVLDLLPMKRVDPVAQLEPVVFDGIVAPGDHDAAVRLEMKNRKIHRRRRHLPDVDHVSSLIQEPLHEGVPDAGRGEAHVAAHGDHLLPALAHALREGVSDQARGFVGEVAVGQAADVVFPKYLRIHRAHLESLCRRYASTKGSRSPSMTRWTSRISRSVRWSLTRVYGWKT